MLSTLGDRHASGSLVFQYSIIYFHRTNQRILSPLNFEIIILGPHLENQKDNKDKTILSLPIK